MQMIAFVRARVPMLDEDRPLGPDVDNIAGSLDDLPLADLGA
jgi:histidine ammonia-lyase